MSHNPDQLAIKAIYMQRDYNNAEIAELLDVRLEDLVTAIEEYRKKQLADPPPAVVKPLKKDSKTKTLRKKKKK